MADAPTKSRAFGLQGAPRLRTRPGRLAALDAWLVRFEMPLLSRMDGDFREAPFVDLGLGLQPWTTLESAATFRQFNPALRVLGVDGDESCVLAAAAHADAQTAFRRGGFALPLDPGERPRLVRAVNVLRQYGEADVEAAHALMGARLVQGGLLMEGSTDRDGCVSVVHLQRRTDTGLRREALLFHTDFSRGFAPILFRDWLPRDLRRRVRPGEGIHGFFEAWTHAWQRVRLDGETDPRLIFVASVQALAQNLDGLCLDPWALAQGYVCWRPAAGVPRAGALLTGS